jgi:hypothetical protein
VKRIPRVSDKAFERNRSWPPDGTVWGYGPYLACGGGGGYLSFQSFRPPKPNRAGVHVFRRLATPAGRPARQQGPLTLAHTRMAKGHYWLDDYTRCPNNQACSTVIVSGTAAALAAAALAATTYASSPSPLHRFDLFLPLGRSKMLSVPSASGFLFH